MKRYAGIAGIMDEAEVGAILGMLDTIDPRRATFGRQSLAVGVLASEKTLRGEKNRYPLRYPYRSEIGLCFGTDERLFNVLHIAADEPDCIEVLRRGLDFAGPRCDAIQINVAWPRRDVLALAREHAERLYEAGFPFILQIGPAALAPYLPRLLRPELATEALDELLGRVECLVASGLVQALLLDVSGGTGTKLDPSLAERLVAYFDHMMQGPKPCRLAVAGGLDGPAVRAMAGLFKRWPRTSLDAEGRLRDEEPGGGRLHRRKVHDYLLAVHEVRA